VRLAERACADEHILCGSEQLGKCGLKSYPGIVSSLLAPGLDVSLSLLPLLAGRSDVGDDRAEEGCGQGRGDYRPRICCQMHEDSMAPRSDIPHDLARPPH
jgi:hypothetical protein